MSAFVLGETLLDSVRNFLKRLLRIVGSAKDDQEVRATFIRRETDEFGGSDWRKSIPVLWDVQLEVLVATPIMFHVGHAQSRGLIAASS